MDEEKFARGTSAVAKRQSKKRNSKTRIVPVIGGVFSREPLGGQIALARYEAMLRIAAQDHPRDHVFVAAVDSDGRKSRHAVLAPGDSIVFGRHDRAGLQHQSDDLSLRHLAIAAAPSSTADDPLVRVWDLVTGHPFKTEDGTPAKAITANGPVFATVGAVFLAIIPLGSLPKKLPIGTLALWQSLPERSIISRVAEGSVVGSLPTPQPSTCQPLTSRRQTKVTHVMPVCGLEDCEPKMAVAELCLTTKGGKRQFRISMEALERGILIGRYERCLNLGGELSVLSRVHLLISKMGQDVVAIDTASTFGSLRNTGRFESTVLANVDDVLLADVFLVEWKYHS